VICLIYVYSEENSLYVTTPNVNESTGPLAIKLVLTNGTQIDTHHVFEYRNNPNFTDIRPRNHLTV